MSTNTTTTKAPKLDFSQWAQPVEEKPRTLREIEREVGFPFAAVAVAPGVHPLSWPTGATTVFTGETENSRGVLPGPPLCPSLGTNPNFPRWILVGHRT